MQLIHTIAGLRSRLAAERAVVFVPTMGNLHEGHLRLVEIARKHGSCVVASIFVNRLQFEPGGDFDRYPRTFPDDCAKLEAAGLKLDMPPTPRPDLGIVIAFITDPWGTRIELTEGLNKF